LPKIRPSLNADGGDVEEGEIIPEGVVKVKLTDACGGCTKGSCQRQERSLAYKEVVDKYSWAATG
jgi:Fe-S cluster biogenesis protein NfuA